MRLRLPGPAAPLGTPSLAVFRSKRVAPWLVPVKSVGRYTASKRDRAIAQFATNLSYLLVKVSIRAFPSTKNQGDHNHGQYSSRSDCTSRLAVGNGHGFDGLCPAKLGKRPCDDHPDQARDRHLSRK